jgi:hypothetical protein
MRAPLSSTGRPSELPTPAAAHRARQTETPGSTAFARLYVTGWLVLSGLAVGYLTLLLVQPEWAAGLTKTASTAETPAKPQRSTSQLALEIDALRRSVADVQRDLAHVKIRLASRQEDAASESSRAAPLERSIESASDEPLAPSPMRTFAPGMSLPGAVASVPVRTIPAPGQPAPVSRALPLTPGSEASPAAASDARPAPNAAAERGEPKGPAATPVNDAPAPGTDELRSRPKGAVVAAKAAEAAGPAKAAEPGDAGRNASPIETGSVTAPQPQIAFGPAKVTPAPGDAGEEPKHTGPAGLVLDSAPNLDALRLKWAFLNERHAALIGDLEARYQVSNRPAGTSYRLLAGPIASAEEARRICAILRAQKVTCSVAAAFSGSTL